jgi:hypothetical protein
VFPETKEQRCWVHYEECRIMWTISRKAFPVRVRALRLSA